MYLQRRENGVWYFRRPVPKELQPYVQMKNSREFNISLHTTKIGEARERRNAHWEHSDCILKEAKTLMEAGVNAAKTQDDRRPVKAVLTKRPLERFTRDELTRLTQSWYAEAHRQTLARYRLLFGEGDSDDRHRAREAVQNELDSLQRKSGASVDLLTPATKRQIVEQAGGVGHHVKSAGFVLVDSYFSQLVREGLIRLRLYALGILETGLPPKLDETTPEFAAEPSNTARTEKPSISVNELIERFKNDPERQHIKPKTRDEFELVYKLMRDAFGPDKPIASITREDAKELQRLYQRMPKRISREFASKSLRELIGIAEEQNFPSIARSTFNKRMTLLAGVFNYAVKEQQLVSSPVLGLTLPDEVRGGEGESTFSDDDLNAIFQDEVFKRFAREPTARFTPLHPFNPSEFWAPLIALFSALRQEEILQLRTTDVAEVWGVEAFLLKAGKNQSLKTAESARKIPVHPTLRELGLLRYRDAMREAGHEFLFPDAKPGATYGNRSQNYSKRFARLLIRVGVKQSKDKKFHGFRHTFIDALRLARVSQVAEYRLSRHSARKDAHDAYGGRLLPLLSEELAKVQYPNLDLSHLKLTSHGGDSGR